MLTTQQVAERLGVTPRRVRALIAAGRLPSAHLGRDHLIAEADLEAFAQQARKRGRPAKEKPE